MHRIVRGKNNGSDNPDRNQAGQDTDAAGNDPGQSESFSAENSATFVDVRNSEGAQNDRRNGSHDPQTKERQDSQNQAPDGLFGDRQRGAGMDDGFLIHLPFFLQAGEGFFEKCLRFENSLLFAESASLVFDADISGVSGFRHDLHHL